MAVLVLSLVACNKTGYFEKEEGSVAEKNESIKDPNALLIAEGKTAVVPDICEITLDYLNIAKDVKPKNAGTRYSQYSAGDNMVYVDLCLTYKNLDTKAISAYDTMKCTLVYAEKYEYTGFSMMEIDNRKDFEYSKNASISPLATEYVHYLFEVPDEVRTGGGKIDVYITTGGSNFRVEADPKLIDTVGKEIHPGKDAVEVVENKRIVSETCEFDIDKVVVTADVLPTNPGDYYSHFEADPGKVIVDMSLYYKNTTGEKIGVDTIGKSTLVLADRYEYNGFIVAEKNDGSEFLDADATSILPLETGKIHHLFMVPEDIRDGSDSVYICFTIDDKEYKYIMR